MIGWARGAGHRSDCKSLPTIHSGDYVAHTATKLDWLKLPLSHTEIYIDGQRMVWIKG